MQSACTGSGSPSNYVILIFKRSRGCSLSCHRHTFFMSRLGWSLPQSPGRTRLWAAVFTIKAVQFAKEIFLLDGELGAVVVLWRQNIQSG